MKIIETEHNWLEYRFELFEKANVVDVYKEKVNTYKIAFSRRGKPVCDCPGFKYHGYCWHSRFVDDFQYYDSIKEPWADWNEDLRLEQRGSI